MNQKLRTDAEDIARSAIEAVKPDEADALPSCKKLGIKTAGKGAFKGGVVLVNDVCDKDLSFEILVNALKTETEADAAEKLFGKN